MSVGREFLSPLSRLDPGRGRAQGFTSRMGIFLRTQSVDELIPLVSHEAPLARTAFPTLDPTWNKERGGNMEGTCPNSEAPKRNGAF